MVVTTTREGGCHCGAVRFEAQVPEPLRGGRCNRSICAKKGAVMVHVALDGVCPYADFPDANIYDGVHHQKEHGGAVRSAGRLRFEVTSE